GRVGVFLYLLDLLERRALNITPPPLTLPTTLRVGGGEPRGLCTRLTSCAPHVSSTTIFPPASSSARAPGGTRQVASYSSMMSGPTRALPRSERRSTGVSIHPWSGPK